MDYEKALAYLYAERAHVIDAIRTLESLLSAETEHARRGRRNMPPEERKSVSERMRRYWAGRRQDK